jgi:hypothetical protein
VPTIVSTGVAGQNIVFIGNLSGDPKQESGSIAYVADTAVDVATFTVPVGKKRILTQVFCSSPISGRMDMLEDSTIIGTARITSGKTDAFFSWLPYREIAAGVVVKMQFTARVGAPAGTVQGYIQSSEATA